MSVRPISLPLHLRASRHSVARQTPVSGPEAARTAGQSAAPADRPAARTSFGFAAGDGCDQAYNEEAFHYFLDIERRRSAASKRLFLLMLIESRLRGRESEMDAPTASALFPALSRCLRETDFVGWYREGRVAGAVLTHHGEPDRDDLPQVVRRRVVAAFKQLIPPDRARTLQVRIYKISPHTQLRRE